MYKLICVSFDGDYVTEGSEFKTVDDAVDRNEDMGSRWFFYPFRFVTGPRGRIIETCLGLELFTNRNIDTVSRILEQASGYAEAEGMDAEEYVSFIQDNVIDGKICLGRNVKK